VTPANWRAAGLIEASYKLSTNQSGPRPLSPQKRGPVKAVGYQLSAISQSRFLNCEFWLIAESDS
jgi:hypothetical protein